MVSLSDAGKSFGRHSPSRRMVRASLGSTRNCAQFQKIFLRSEQQQFIMRTPAMLESQIKQTTVKVATLVRLLTQISECCNIAQT